MTDSALPGRYRQYIDCLNTRDFDALGSFVGDDVIRNGEILGLSGYRELLRGDFRAIPDLSFTIELLVADATRVAARLAFDCTPVGDFLGIPVHGRRVAFTEHVFYTYADDKIAEVHSVIDTTGIRAQLGPGPGRPSPA